MIYKIFTKLPQITLRFRATIHAIFRTKGTRYTDLFGTWDRHCDGRDSVAPRVVRGRETVSSQDNATNHVTLNNKIILL